MADDARRDPGVRRHFTGTKHFLGDDFPVDSKTERAAKVRISLEWGTVQIESVVIDAQVGVCLILLGHVTPDPVALTRRNARSPVEFACSESLELRVHIFSIDVLDAIDRSIFVVPVIRIPLQRDVRLNDPLHQLVSAITDKFAGLSKFTPVLLQAGTMNGICRRMHQHPQKIWRWPFQPNHQRVHINRFNTERIRRSLPGNHILCIKDGRQNL